MKQKTAYLGLFSAVAIILGYVESLVPVFAGIPGIKLGLANLGVLFILKKYSYCDDHNAEKDLFQPDRSQCCRRCLP